MKIPALMGLKTLVILLAAVAAAASAQNKKFIKSMEKNLGAMDTCKTQGSYQKVANTFERIANAEKKEWLPYYYAADTYILIGYMEPDKNKMDEYFDKAQGFADKADSLMPDNSEIITLKAWILSAKIGVAPMQRGSTLGPQSGILLDKAIGLDKTNPRPYYLKAMSAMYTPPMFGGGKDKAIPLFEKSLELFGKFKPSSTIMPNWGEKQAREGLEKCRKM
jgi:tetratricopeptide (TPR) repeat protein